MLLLRFKELLVLTSCWLFSWQWMAGGRHGANGHPVGQNAPTGAGGSARHQHPRMGAKTAMAWSCNPRTALMDCACKVSQSEETQAGAEGPKTKPFGYPERILVIGDTEKQKEWDDTGLSQLSFIIGKR